MKSHTKEEHFQLINENKIYTVGQYRWFFKNKLTTKGYYQIPWFSFGYKSYGNFFIDAWEGKHTRKELNKLAVESKTPAYCIYHKNNEVIKGKTFCFSCKEKTDEIISKNKCKSHHNEDCIPGRKVCHICISNTKKRIQKNKSIGKCVSNGHGNRNVVPGRTLCVECLNTLKQINKKRVEKGKLLGKCIRHSNRDAAPGKTRCAECIQKINKKINHGS